MSEAKTDTFTKMLRQIEVDAILYFYMLPPVTNPDLIELKYPPQDLAVTALKTFVNHPNFDRKALPKLFECAREYLGYVSDVNAVRIMALLPDNRREFWRLMLINFCAALRPDEDDNPKLDFWAFQTTHRLAEAMSLYRPQHSDFGRVLGFSKPDDYEKLIDNVARKRITGDEYTIKIKYRSTDGKEKGTVYVPVRLPFVATATYVVAKEVEEEIATLSKINRAVILFVLNGIAIYGPTRIDGNIIEKMRIDFDNTVLFVSVLIGHRRN